jgi:nitrogen fixation protein NifU and related proteins
MTQATTSPYSARAIDHATTPRNMGILQNYNGHAKITGPCGDTMEFWVFVQNDTIQKIAWTTDGCASSRACGSMTSYLALQESVEFATQLSQQDVLNELGRFPAESEHCALLATNTLHAAVLKACS